MTLAIVITAVLVGGFFSAKLSMEFLDLLMGKLKEDSDDRRD